MSLGDSVTWADWVRLVASEHGVYGLSDDDVEYLLWERTAWPICDVPYLRRQVIDVVMDEGEDA
jgi:hypothetical protein